MKKLRPHAEAGAFPAVLVSAQRAGRERHEPEQRCPLVPANPPHSRSGHHGLPYIMAFRSQHRDQTRILSVLVNEQAEAQSSSLAPAAIVSPDRTRPRATAGFLRSSGCTHGRLLGAIRGFVRSPPPSTDWRSCRTRRKRREGACPSHKAADARGAGALPDAAIARSGAGGRLRRGHCFGCHVVMIPQTPLTNWPSAPAFRGRGRCRAGSW